MYLELTLLYPYVKIAVKAIMVYAMNAEMRTKPSLTSTQLALTGRSLCAILAKAMQVLIMKPVKAVIKKATFSQYSLCINGENVFMGSRHRCIAVFNAVARAFKILELKYDIEVQK